MTSIMGYVEVRLKILLLATGVIAELRGAIGSASVQQL